MNVQDFEALALVEKVDYVRSNGRLLHTEIRGNMMIMLYWTEHLVLEVFVLINPREVYEVKGFDRFRYAA